jgi:LacI family transcriptional regulator
MHHASRSVDGLLISLSSETVDLNYLKELYKKGLPIVFFDRITYEIKTHKVIANNYMGAFQATEHLILQGFKKIAHITSAPYLSITKERLLGYKEALKKHKIPFDKSLIKYCIRSGMIAEEIDEAISQLFKGRTRPDAIFTASDRITTVCFAALKKLKPKKDLGFAGFSNTKVGELFDPPMTVVHQPAFEIGQNATELLIQMIESKQAVVDFETRILDTELIIRESSLRKKKV